MPEPEPEPEVLEPEVLEPGPVTAQPCADLLSVYSVCGSYCGACRPDWVVAPVDAATCNAWSFHMRLAGWDSATIRVSGLPKSFLKARPDGGPTPRETLHSLAKPFGLSSIAILHASRVALLEMESNAAADTMLAQHAATPLQISENIQLL